MILINIMSKVSIITRAFNRLEYTVMVVREVYNKANGADYEHIIVEQNSSDGTAEWLKSIEQEGFYKLKVIYNNKNSGDAGGMYDGFKTIDVNSKYTLQLDNDLMPLTFDFINKLSTVMDMDSTIGSIMLKRENVGRIMENIKSYKSINNISLYYIKKNHGLFFRNDLLNKLNYWKRNEEIGWVEDICKKINILGYKILKTNDIKVDHIDGTGNQVKKYKLYYNKVLNNKTNYSDIIY